MQGHPEYSEIVELMGVLQVAELSVVDHWKAALARVRVMYGLSPKERTVRESKKVLKLIEHEVKIYVTGEQSRQELKSNIIEIWNSN